MSSSANDRTIIKTITLATAAAFAWAAPARAADPIKIGVIAEAQAVVGASIPRPCNSPPTRSTPRAASTDG